MEMYPQQEALLNGWAGTTTHQLSNVESVRFYLIHVI